MEVHTKNILITGGVGFIGSHLASYLAQNGAKIICLDDFSTCNTKNINDLKKHPNIKILKHDVRIPIDTSVDEIYNLASPASPAKYQKDPIKTLQTIKMQPCGSKNYLRSIQTTNRKTKKLNIQN